MFEFYWLMLMRLVVGPLLGLCLSGCGWFWLLVWFVNNVVYSFGSCCLCLCIV